MKIFEENGRIRLQLKDTKRGLWLFDFQITKERYEKLASHIIEHLLAFKVS